MSAHRGVWVAGDAKHMGAIFEGTEPKGAKFGAIGHVSPQHLQSAPQTQQRWRRTPAAARMRPKQQRVRCWALRHR